MNQIVVQRFSTPYGKKVSLRSGMSNMQPFASTPADTVHMCGPQFDIPVACSMGQIMLDHQYVKFCT